MKTAVIKDFLLKHRLKFVFGFLGAIAGFAYWHFVGCASGSCPIQSKWYLSTLYGGILGFLVAGLFKTNKKENQQI